VPPASLDFPEMCLSDLCDRWLAQVSEDQKIMVTLHQSPPNPHSRFGGDFGMFYIWDIATKTAIASVPNPSIGSSDLDIVKNEAEYRIVVDSFSRKYEFSLPDFLDFSENYLDVCEMLPVSYGQPSSLRDRFNEQFVYLHNTLETVCGDA
jgi:hypothetical protein